MVRVCSSRICATRVWEEAILTSRLVTTLNSRFSRMATSKIPSTRSPLASANSVHLETEFVIELKGSDYIIRFEAPGELKHQSEFGRRASMERRRADLRPDEGGCHGSRTQKSSPVDGAAPCVVVFRGWETCRPGKSQSSFPQTHEPEPPPELVPGPL